MELTTGVEARIFPELRILSRSYNEHLIEVIYKSIFNMDSSKDSGSRRKSSMKNTAQQSPNTEGINTPKSPTQVPWPGVGTSMTVDRQTAYLISTDLQQPYLVYQGSFEDAQTD